MNIHGFETIDSLPALYRPSLDLLIVSDLHLGLEGTMTSDGNYVPKHQLDDILGDIEELKVETNASRILVNGDLKNEFKTSRYSESQEIKKLIDFLREGFDEIILIKGNHDTFIESTVEEKGLELKEFYQEEGILFTHGHIGLDELDAKDYETVVIGHEHPALALTDDIGMKEKVDCFLFGQTSQGKDIVVLPAFSSISNGTNINETPQSQLLSPILRNQVNKSELEAVAVSREAGMFKFPEIGKI